MAFDGDLAVQEVPYDRLLERLLDDSPAPEYDVPTKADNNPAKTVYIYQRQQPSIDSDDEVPALTGDSTMLQVMIAMGGFVDDQAMFDRAREYFPSGKGNGAIGNYFRKANTMPGARMRSGAYTNGTGAPGQHLRNSLDPRCRYAWIVAQSSPQRL